MRYADFQLNNGTYIPQYAGSPLEEINQTSNTLQERHYKNLADLSNLQLLRQQYESKVVPGAKDYIRNQFNDIDETLQDIAKNGAENSTAKIAALRNKFLGDQGVLGALRTSEGVAKEVEQENEILSKGLKPLRKPGVREAAINTPVIDPNTGKLHELYTKPYQSTVTPYIDPTEDMRKIWSIINPDSIEGELKGLDSTRVSKMLQSATANGLPDIPVFFESLTQAGIPGEKIKNNLNNAFDTYKETPAYKQAIEYSDNPQAEEKRQKKIFLENGLLRVFNNLSRQDMVDPLARAGRGKANTTTTHYNPDLSIVSPAPKTPIDNLEHINENGEVKETNLGVALESAAKTFSKEPETRETEEISIGGFPILKRPKAATSEALTKEAIPYYKAAALFADIPNSTNMSEEQLKKWAGSDQGKTALQYYKDNVLTQKYKAPIIQNIDEEKARDAHNLFINSTLSQRKLIPFDEPNRVIHMSDIPLGKGDKEALNVSKWLGTDPNKIRVIGETTPQNWLGEGTDVEGEFTNAGVIEVPTGDGKTGEFKRYYVSNLPSETNLLSVNEKVLANVGKRIPGVPSKTQDGTEVYETINDNSRKALYQELQVPEILKWPSVVVVRKGDITIVAPNYAKAAEEMAKQNMYITNSK